MTKDLIVTGFAALTGALVAWLLALVDIHVHFAIYAFSWNFIPLGAILCGALAGSGYYLGFQLFPHRPTRLLLLNAILSSVAVYFLVYYIAYSLAEVNGAPVSRLVSFGRYMSLVIENRRQYVYFTNFGRVGPLGYLLVAAQLAGFVIGGFFVVRTLMKVPCCDHCDRILKNPKVMLRPSNSLLGLEDLFGKMRSALAAGRSAEAIQLMASPGAGPGNAAHKLFLTLWKCDRCPVEFYSMFIKPGGDHVGHALDYSPTRSRAIGV